MNNDNFEEDMLYRKNWLETVLDNAKNLSKEYCILCGKLRLEDEEIITKNMQVHGGWKRFTIHKKCIEKKNKMCERDLKWYHDDTFHAGYTDESVSGMVKTPFKFFTGEDIKW